MNKKEISEIKKTLKPERCSVEYLRTCYVSDGGRIVATHAGLFLSLEEEEQHKYTEILKKALSGRLNRSLVELSFTNEAEETDGIQMRLYHMMKDEAKDDEKAEELLSELAAAYKHTGNFLIILAFGKYDVPMKATDGAMLDDSEDVYSYLLCCFCPVELSKPGLCYSDEDKTFINSPRGWMAGMPETAFTFPAFTDRASDIHHVMYYMKKPAEPHTEIEEEFLCCVPPMATDDQIDAFHEVIEETLGEEASVENIVALNREIESFVAAKENDNEQPVMSGREMNHILSATGIDKQVDSEEFEVMADVVADEKYVFESDGMKLQVTKDYIDLVEQAVVGGRNCLVLPLNGATLNGIRLKPKKS